MTENRYLLNIIEDKFRRFERTDTPAATDFLDLAQQSAAAGFVRSHRGEGVFWYGGFPEAERKQIIFVPDYFGIENEDDLFEFFLENPGECPLKVLEVRAAKEGLRHTDYLGALMSLGVKREKTGDILVEPSGAHIFVVREIAPYLAENYTLAGRISLECEAVDPGRIELPEPEKKEIKEALSSLRLDNAVAAVFEVSRKNAAEAINRGLVFVDNVEMKKADRVIKEGEKIVLRGKGKAVYKGSGGITRKGKVLAVFDKY